MRDLNCDDIDKNIKKVANDINIEVPEKLRKSVLNSLDKLPERKIKKNNGYKKAAGFIGILLGGLLTFNSFMPVYAESLPIIGPTFKSINESIGFGGKYEEKAKAVDLTKKYKDKTMTIKNVYYDGIELAIAYEIKSENGFDKKPVIFPIITRGIQDINYKNENSKGEFADENTYVGFASYVFQEKQLTDKTNINFLVNDIYGDWVGVYPKKFNFKLNLDSENMGRKSYKIDKEFEYENSIFKVTSVDVSPFNTILHYETDKVREIQVGSVSEDEPNGVLDTKHNIRFFIIDDKGMPIDSKGGSCRGSIKGNRFKESGVERFIGFTDEMNSIKIIPVIQYSDNESLDGISDGIKKNRLNKSSETTIKLGNDEEYIIKNIEFKEDKTIINIKVRRYLNSIENIELAFEDEEKNEIKIENTEFNGIDNGYDFILTLPKLDSSKEYYATLFKYNKTVILEDEIITIDIDNNDKSKN